MESPGATMAIATGIVVGVILILVLATTLIVIAAVLIMKRGK